MGANTGTGYVDEKRGSVRATDVGSYNPVRTTGEPDFAKTDYLEVRINGASRGVDLRAKNDDVSVISPELTFNGGNPVAATFAWFATPADNIFYTAPCKMRVKAVNFRPTVTAAGATAVVRKVPTAIAITSGTALHSNSLTLDGTTNVNQAGTLSVTAADLIVAAGDSLAVDFTGTTTNSTGVVTVTLTPIE